MARMQSYRVSRRDFSNGCEAIGHRMCRAFKQWGYTSVHAGQALAYWNQFCDLPNAAEIIATHGSIDISYHGITTRSIRGAKGAHANVRIM